MMPAVSILTAWIALGAVPAKPAPDGADDRAVRQALADLASGDWVLQAAAMVRLARYGRTEAVAPLRGVLSGDERPWIRARAALALAHLTGEAVLRDAAGLAAHEDARVRAVATEALGVIGSARGLETIRRRLADESPAVQAAAIVAMARVEKAAAWEAASSRLAGRDPTVVRGAVAALAYVPTPAARDKLVELLGARGSDVRIAAADALAVRARADTIAPLLARAADEGDGRVREALADAAAAVDADVRVPLLLGLLKDGPPELLPGAASLLARTPGEEVCERVAAGLGDLARRNPKAVPPALQMLGAFDADRYHEALAGFLSHDDADIRRSAVRAVGRARQADVVVLLGRRLADDDPGVRYAARESLQRAAARGRQAGAAAGLAGAIRSQDAKTRHYALQLLRRLITPDDLKQALEVLGALLAGADDETRRLAVEALAEIVEPEEASQVARAQGYLTAWHVIGPFTNDSRNSGFARAYPPEKTIDFQAKYTGVAGTEVQWVHLDLADPAGRIDFENIFWETYPFKVGYALAEVTSSAQRKANLLVKAMGPCAVWLNGEAVEELPEGGDRPAAVTIRKGLNRILVKSCRPQTRSGWYFSLRVTDPAGAKLPGLTCPKQAQASRPKAD